MPAPPQRFPLPWRVCNNDDAYWIEDAAGARFGFCYFTDYPLTGTGMSAKQTRDGARRLVEGFVKLGDLLE